MDLFEFDDVSLSESDHSNESSDCLSSSSASLLDRQTHSHSSSCSSPLDLLLDQYVTALDDTSSGTSQTSADFSVHLHGNNNKIISTNNLKKKRRHKESSVVCGKSGQEKGDKVSLSLASLIGGAGGEVSPPLQSMEKRQRRKRARTEAEKEQRAEERKLKNRQSAMRSRQRVLNELKKDKGEITKLEEKCDLQARIIQELRKQLEEAKQVNQQLEQRNLQSQELCFNVCSNCLSLSNFENEGEEDARELGLDVVGLDEVLYNEKASFFGDSAMWIFIVLSRVIIFSLLLETKSSHLQSPLRPDIFNRSFKLALALFESLAVERLKQNRGVAFARCCSDMLTTQVNCNQSLVHSKALVMS